MSRVAFAAVDVGASSGRVIEGIVDAGRIDLRAVHRFANGPVEIDGHLRWDFERIEREVSYGLAQLDDVISIGIDTWGVDYGLLDDAGRLLALPISYRDPRTNVAVTEVHRRISPAGLYRTTGVQFLPFNTIYQLMADQLSGRGLDEVRHVVLLPDLLAYRLTGAIRTEITNASTTGLLDSDSRQWSAEVFDRLGIPSRLLPPLESPGAVRGATSAGVAVTTVASHDTASAVVAVPAVDDNFAFISSGTWSLVGLELERAELSDRSRLANFTNEVGYQGRTRFLRNVGGLWLLDECMRSWKRVDLDSLLAQAAQAPPGPLFDVDDPAFIAPGGMPERIARAAGAEHLSVAAIVRSILDSLADAYARTIDEATRLTGKRAAVVHVVGGGCRNRLLCQLTANATNLPVVAGPIEATAFGNVLVQAGAHGVLGASLSDMRALVANSVDLQRYEPA